MNGNSKFGPLIGVIHIGHINCKFLIYASKNAEVLTCHEVKLSKISPYPGWVEFDPREIWRAVTECIETAINNLIILDINPKDMVSIGITNQRETTVLWHKISGLPLYNAIGWCDTRTSSIVDSILVKAKIKINYLKSVCGLPLSTCFSAVKIKWMIENVKEVRESMREDLCLFGTLDTWILWNLTGGVVHITDVTNASRTMLMNLETLEWDYRLCNFFKISQKILPKIKSSSEIYGYIYEGPLTGIPIASILGDQQASLIGQLCMQSGQSTCTIDDGCFLLMNTGQEIIDSDYGLLSTVAFKLGPNEKPFYALEGSIAHAGSTLSWLKNNLNIEIESANHNNSSLVQSYVGNELPMITSFCSQPATMCYAMDDYYKHTKNDVIFIPAFSGYYTPYWKYRARGLLFGLNAETTAQHVIYACYEAICLQTKEVLNSLHNDCRTWPLLNKVIVGGELSEKSFLMQLMADLCGIMIERPQTSTPACLGTMLSAGLASNLLTLQDFRNSCVPPVDIFIPNLNDNQRDIKFRKWKCAVDKCLNFQSYDDYEVSKIALQDKDPYASVYNSIPGGLFFFTSFAIVILAQILLNN